MVNDSRFRQLDIVVDDVYEIEMNKKTVKYALPVHVGFFVLQYAKMRMLQLYYDFINRYLERPLFQYCEMYTDSAYLAFPGESVDVLVTPEVREHYFRHRSEWLPSECLCSMCAVDSPISCGPVTGRAVRRAERSTRGRRVYSKLSAPVTGSWGCADVHHIYRREFLWHCVILKTSLPVAQGNPIFLTLKNLNKT